MKIYMKTILKKSLYYLACLFTFCILSIPSSAQKLYVQEFTWNDKEVNIGIRTGAKVVESTGDTCAFITIRAPKDTKVVEENSIHSISYESGGVIHVWVLAHNGKHKGNCCIWSAKKIHLNCPGYEEQLEVTFSDYKAGLDSTRLHNGEFLIGNTAYNLKIVTVPDLYNEAMEKWHAMDFYGAKKKLEDAKNQKDLNEDKRKLIEYKLNELNTVDKGLTNLELWEKTKNGANKCYQKFHEKNKEGAPKDTLKKHLEEAQNWYNILYIKSRSSAAEKMYYECGDLINKINGYFSISGTVKKVDDLRQGVYKNPGVLANKDITLRLCYNKNERVIPIKTDDNGRFFFSSTSDVEPDYIVIEYLRKESFKEIRYSSKIDLKKSTKRIDRSWKELEVTLVKEKK